MWQPIDASMFGDFKPVETYLYYNGPLAFTIQHNDRTFYVHSSDEEDEYHSSWVREVTPADLALLENNGITVKQFLLNAETMYLIRYYNENKIEAFIVDPKEFSDDHFPTEGVYLCRSEVAGEDSLMPN